MLRRSLPLTLMVPMALTLLALAAPALAKKVAPKPVADEPPLEAWIGVWHTGATVSYSSCPGTEPGHQEAFTLLVKPGKKGVALVATEQPEQSLERRFTGSAELRGKRWVLELRDKDGKNGMDVYLSDDGKSLLGTRVVIRRAKKLPCTVVYGLEGTRDDA